MPKLKTELAATSASLGDLKNSFLLTRDDVTKLGEQVTSVKQGLERAGGQHSQLG
ncbi:MAG: hypothetical protein HYY01_06890 [Chloroflexi bacterium]|nr:hypothetical protein [Chloroflexota bacterium]